MLILIVETSEVLWVQWCIYLLSSVVVISFCLYPLVTDNDGKTPLDWAKLCSLTEVIEYLQSLQKRTISLQNCLMWQGPSEIVVLKLACVFMIIEC